MLVEVMTMKMYCHCGAEVMNGHHCKNGHMMIRDSGIHIIDRLDANCLRMCRLALEFGYRAAQCGMTLDEAFSDYNNIRPADNNETETK